jgi:hypothetical protein
MVVSCSVSWCLEELPVTLCVCVRECVKSDYIVRNKLKLFSLYFEVYLEFLRNLKILKFLCVYFTIPRGTSSDVLQNRDWETLVHTDNKHCVFHSTLRQMFISPRLLSADRFVFCLLSSDTLWSVKTLPRIRVN